MKIPDITTSLQIRIFSLDWWKPYLLWSYDF